MLREWQDGSQEALDRLAPLVYDELHALASRHLAHEWRHDHHFQGVAAESGPITGL